MCAEWKRNSTDEQSRAKEQHGTTWNRIAVEWPRTVVQCNGMEWIRAEEQRNETEGQSIAPR